MRIWIRRTVIYTVWYLLYKMYIIAQCTPAQLSANLLLAPVRAQLGWLFENSVSIECLPIKSLHIENFHMSIHSTDIMRR